MPARFQWLAAGVEPPFTLAVLDASYRTLVAIEGLAGTSWAADARVTACLAGGGTFHWFVAAIRQGVPCRSPLASFEIR